VTLRTLLIGDDETRKIAAVIALAKLHPFDLATLAAASIAKGDDLRRWKVRLDPFTIPLPEGFLVTYTHERHEIGLCAHINISVDALGMIPHPLAVAAICKQFGLFDPKLRLVESRPEEYPNGRISLHIVALLADSQ
jgi:hypothetical protein